MIYNGRTISMFLLTSNVVVGPLKPVSSRPSAKSPFSALPAATKRLARFCYSPAEFIGKSPSNPLRRTVVSSLDSSGLRSRTTLKYSVGNKSELMNSSRWQG